MRLFCLHIVAPESAMIAQIKAAIGNDGVSPGLFHLLRVRRLGRRGETAFFTIRLRIRINQSPLAVFPPPIEPAIRIKKGGTATAAVLPVNPSRPQAKP